MVINKEVVIAKSVQDVWNVLGNQFGAIDKWASLISKSEVSGRAELPGVNYSIRSTQTKRGATKQQLTVFDPEKHVIAYEAIEGRPFFLSRVEAKWSVTDLYDGRSKLNLDMDIDKAGLAGVILGPLAKVKLGKLADELMDEFKYYSENDKPHPRKVASME